jgi:hypothetical protein
MFIMACRCKLCLVSLLFYAMQGIHSVCMSLDRELKTEQSSENVQLYSVLRTAV